MDEDRNLAYGNGLKKLAGKLIDKTGDVNSKFKGIVTSGLATQTIKDINSDLDTMNLLTEGTGNAFIKHTNEMFDSERANASAIDSMNIPKDFEAENAQEINYYNTVLLSKINVGKEVTEGKITEKVNDVEESGVVREALKDINNNVTEDQVYDASSSIVGQSILGNINGNKTEEKVYDDTSRVSNQQLRNIGGNTTEGQMYNDMSTIVGQSILGNINGEKETAKQELNEGNIISAVLNEKRENEEKEQK